MVGKNNHGSVIEDYSAKELDIDEGTIVEKIKELNGWLWSKNTRTNEIGWVPSLRIVLDIATKAVRE
ncbi:MAG: hypothetical protein FWC98_01795 [Bacteroidales bacterium]|nr:hypothetical protein [Bacteroidales bacterium]